MAQEVIHRDHQVVSEEVDPVVVALEDPQPQAMESQLLLLQITVPHQVVDSVEIVSHQEVAVSHLHHPKVMELHHLEEVVIHQDNRLHHQVMVSYLRFFH